MILSRSHKNSIINAFRVLIIIVFSSNSSFSQDKLVDAPVDSLWSVWNDDSQNDTIRLRAYYLVIWKAYLFSQPDSAFYHAQQMYDFAKNQGDTSKMGDALNTQGASYFLRSEYEKAEEYFLRCYRLFKQINDLEGLAGPLGNLGIIYMYLGDYVSAFESNERSLEVNRKLKDTNGEISSLVNLGIIYKNKGEEEKALEMYDQALEKANTTDNKRGIASALNGKAMLYLDSRNFNKANDLFNESIQFEKRIEGQKTGLASGYLNKGLTLFHMGELDSSMYYYHKSLNLYLEIGGERSTSTILNNIGVVYAKREMLDSALAYSIQSLHIAQQTKSVKNRANALESLYDYYLKKENSNGAYSVLSKTIQLRNENIQTNFFLLGENEKHAYFSTLEEDYGRYFDFALHYQNQFENVTDTAYNIALQNKGLTLKSSTAVRQTILKSKDSLLINQYEEWLSIKETMVDPSTSDSLYDVLEKKSIQMERNLVKQSNSFSDVQSIRNLDWKNVQKGLKKNEAAIEFVRFNSQIDTINDVLYAAIIVKKDLRNPLMIKLCSEKEIENVLGQLQGNTIDFVENVYGNNDQPNTALYNLIWKPIEKEFRNIDQIYVSPVGLLHKVAFHALSIKKNVNLCDHYNIRHKTSTASVNQKRRLEFSPSDRVFVIGGIDYTSDSTQTEVWSYLSSSLDETENIDAFLSKKGIEVEHLKKEKATEEAFKEQVEDSFQLVHIATHGFFFPDPEKVKATLKERESYLSDISFRGQAINSEKIKESSRYAYWNFIKHANPLQRSGLAFAFANDVWQRPPLIEGEDGVLTANEVKNLNLQHTKLIVLSACETGLGDIKGSEGVFGLQRAFKIAGTGYIMMSLWKVPDQQTAEFMNVFYEELTKQNTIQGAYEAAQMKMRKKYDPYFWAAFVLVE